MIDISELYLKMRGGIVLAMLAMSSGAMATETLQQVFDRPSTSGVSLGTQFFYPPKQDEGTSLPVTSVMVDETSVTEDSVTAAEPAAVVDSETTETATATAETTGALTDTGETAATTGTVETAEQPQTDLSDEEESLAESLPVKVDNSSTAAQVRQLGEFEKRNQIGEAFLLAVELVNANPRSEFAYDAAIRNSLILGLDEDIEKHYREAIKQSDLPGKYYVQLAHYYQRTGRMEQLQKLISDYAKENASATDYRITLARLFSVAGDQEALTALFDRQGFTDDDIFPLLQIQVKAYADAGQDDRATSIILTAMNRDLGMLQQRLLLQEMLRLNDPAPEHVMALVQASLSNETNYGVARKVADNVIRQAEEKRYLTRLDDYLTSQAQGRRLTDVERWTWALISQKFGQADRSLAILTAETAGSTPVISYERAKGLIAADRSREAIPILTTLLSEQPDELSIRMMLAQEMSKLRQTTNTLQLLGSLNFQDLPPEYRSEYATLTISSHILNREAERLIEAWQGIAPNAHFEVLQAMGDTVVGYASDGDFRRRVAETALGRLEGRSNAWPLYLLLARLSATAGESISELEYYAKYLEHDRHNVRMLRFVAELALLHAGMEITLAPEQSLGNRPVTIRASQSAATAAAVEFYRRLIELQPRLPENYSALMRAYQTRSEIGLAKKVGLEYADRMSSSPEALAAAANMLHDNGFAEDALSMYRAALLAAPDQFQTWMNYATVLREEGKVEPATNILKKILEEGLHGVPFNQPAVFANLLGIAQDSGTTEALATYLDEVREKPIPGKAEFYVSSAKVLMQIGAPDKARVFLEEFIEKEPENRLIPDGLLLLGQVQYMLGEFERSLETFLQVRDDHGDTPAAITASYNAAEIQRRLGNLEEAITTWIRLAQSRPDEDKALEAIYVAALSAWNDMENHELAVELMEQYVASDSQDYAKLERARQSLVRMKAGQPPLDDES